MFFGGGGGGFPFGGMGGDPFGGMGGMGGGDVDTDEYYNTLGVDKNATDSEIKKAYRKLAMKHHPDRGGDPDLFKEMTEAHTVLSDPEKRKRYDRGGKEAVEGGGGNPFQRRGSTSTKKGPSTTHVLKVTLEDLYCGKTKKMKMQRKTIDREKGVQKCTTCKGQGVVIRQIRMGPMIQQMQAPCEECNQEGFLYARKKTTEILEVNIQKGAPDGHKIVMRNKGDEIPDGDAGDIIFVLKQQEHDVYKRKGADLFIQQKISLVEALCGFSLDLPKLDGRKLLVKTKPGQICKPCAFDPFAPAEEVDWEVMEDTDCTLEDMAKAETTDLDVLKKAVNTQLKGKNIGCFVVKDGQTTFKQGTRAECLEAKKKRSGATMYVLGDENASSSKRMMRAVEGEGLPLMRDPYQFGNLFLQLEIVFPDEITEPMRAALQAALPPALNSSEADESAEDVDTQECTVLDPVASYKDGVFQNKDSYDDDDDDDGHPGMRGQNVQCAQQ